MTDIVYSLENKIILQLRQLIQLQAQTGNAEIFLYFQIYFFD